MRFASPPCICGLGYLAISAVIPRYCPLPPSQNQARSINLACYSLYKPLHASSFTLVCFVAPCSCYGCCLLRLMSPPLRDRRQHLHTPTHWRPHTLRTTRARLNTRMRGFLLEATQSARGRHKHDVSGPTTTGFVQAPRTEQRKATASSEHSCCAAMASSPPSASPHTDKRTICPRILERTNAVT
ncbi:hypothetical protein HDV57DRAFT_112891 [Trichoderma longibrachiatum]